MSERILQDAFAKWLTSQGIPFFRQRMDKAATGTLGWPDFTICSNGRCLLVETKFKKGKLSTKQVFKHAELEKAGCRVFVVRELTAAIALVTEWRQAVAGPVYHPPNERTFAWKGMSLRQEPDGSVTRA